MFLLGHSIRTYEFDCIECLKLCAHVRTFMFQETCGESSVGQLHQRPVLPGEDAAAATKGGRYILYIHC